MGWWDLDLEPHIATMAKRIFPKISASQTSTLRVLANDETCRDLEWLISRYPIRVRQKGKLFTGEVELKRRARKYDEAIRIAWQIVRGEYNAPPFKMAKPPREYQKQAATLCHVTGGMLLADDLGVGKTISGIALLSMPNTLPTLVVVPTHLQRHWRDKLAEFTPDLTSHIIKKGTPYDARKKAKGDIDVFICTYSKLAGWRDVLRREIKTVIFDEIQELRTGSGTQKYWASKDIADASSYRLGLSATPIYNYGGEFWHILNCLSPDVAGTQQEFFTQWCHGIYTSFYGLKKAKIKDPAAFGLHLRDKGVMLRRTRKQVGRELPDLTRVVQEVESDKAALTTGSDAASKLAAIILDQNASREERFTATGRFESWMRQATGIAKAPFVAEFVNMLLESDAEPLVLFGWHREVYSIWQEKLKHFNPVMFTGSESESQKRRSEETFKAGQSKVLIMSLRSGSGLDGLQHVSSRVVFGELDWTEGVHEQCTGRVHRDGQTSPVFAYYPVAKDGADPIMIDVLGVKRQQLEGVRDPLGDIVRPKKADQKHIRQLAEAYMASRAKR